MKKSFGKTLIISFLIVFLVAFTGSFVSYDMDWYKQSKPSFAPPDYLFGIVWPILYIMIALSLALAWTKSNKKQRKKVALFYGVNLVANALWTQLFFGLRWPLLALLDIILIWATIIILIVFMWKIDRRASWLLLPYLIWVSFATILSMSFI